MPQRDTDRPTAASTQEAAGASGGLNRKARRAAARSGVVINPAASPEAALAPSIEAPNGAKGANSAPQLKKRPADSAADAEVVAAPGTSGRGGKAALRKASAAKVAEEAQQVEKRQKLFDEALNKSRLGEGQVYYSASAFDWKARSRQSRCQSALPVFQEGVS